MIYEKQPLTIEDQIKQLKTRGASDSRRRICSSLFSKYKLLQTRRHFRYINKLMQYVLNDCGSIKGLAISTFQIPTYGWKYSFEL
jgi:hypothetical protein